MMKGLVKFDMGNLGHEVWLVANPRETVAAFVAAAAGESSGDTSPLDAAARVSVDAIVLAAHWGNEIPTERDNAWLTEVLDQTVEEDKEEVRDLVETYWSL